MASWPATPRTAKSDPVAVALARTPDQAQTSSPQERRLAAKAIRMGVLADSPPRWRTPARGAADTAGDARLARELHATLNGAATPPRATAEDQGAPRQEAASSMARGMPTGVVTVCSSPEFTGDPASSRAPRLVPEGVADPGVVAVARKSDQAQISSPQERRPAAIAARTGAPADSPAGREAAFSRNRGTPKGAIAVCSSPELTEDPASAQREVLAGPNGTPPIGRAGAPLSPTLSFHSERGSPAPACRASPVGRWVSPGGSRLPCSPTFSWNPQSPDASACGTPTANSNREPVSVQLRLPEGRFVPLQIRAADSVRTLRTFLAERTGIPSAHLTLALHSRSLREDTPLLDQGVDEASCVSVAVRLFGGSGDESGPSPRRRRHPKRAADSNASPLHTVAGNREARRVSVTGSDGGPDASSISVDLQELSLGEAKDRTLGGQSQGQRGKPESPDEPTATPLPTPTEAPNALGSQLRSRNAR